MKNIFLFTEWIFFLAIFLVLFGYGADLYLVKKAVQQTHNALLESFRRNQNVKITSTIQKQFDSAVITSKITPEKKSTNLYKQIGITTKVNYLIGPEKEGRGLELFRIKSVVSFDGMGSSTPIEAELSVWVSWTGALNFSGPVRPFILDFPSFSVTLVGDSTIEGTFNSILEGKAEVIFKGVEATNSSRGMRTANVNVSLNREFKGTYEDWSFRLKSSRIDDIKETVSFGPLDINMVFKGVDLKGHFSKEDFFIGGEVLRKKMDDIALAFNNLEVEVKNTSLKTPEGLVNADGEIFLPLADMLSSNNGAEMVRGKMAVSLPAGMTNLLIFDISGSLAGWAKTGYLTKRKEDNEVILPIEWSKNKITAAGKIFDSNTFFASMRTAPLASETKSAVVDAAVVPAAAAPVDDSVPEAVPVPEEKENKREVASVVENIPDKVVPEVNKLEVRDTAGLTPLINAVLEKDMDRLELLLSAGADPNGADRFGQTPLMHAVQRNNLPAMRTLILKGAIKELKNARGQTAVDMLRSENAKNILAITKGPASPETKKEN